MLWQYLTVPAVLLLLVVVLLRFSKLARVSRQVRMNAGSRRLSSILAVLLVTVLIKIPFVGQVVDDLTGVDGLQVLVRDASAIFMAFQAVTAMYEITRRSGDGLGPLTMTSLGDDDVVSRRVKRVARITMAIVGLCLVGMTIAWSMAPAGKDGILHMSPATGNGWPLIYWMVYSVTYFAAAAAVAYLSLGWALLRASVRASARVHPRSQRTQRSMIFFGSAGVFAMVYLSAKLIMLALRHAGLHDHFLVTHTGLIQLVPQAVSILLIVLATTVAAPGARRLRRKFYPLWSLVTSASGYPVTRSAGVYRRCLDVLEAGEMLTGQLTAAEVESIRAAAAQAPAAARPYLIDAALLELATRRWPLAQHGATRVVPLTACRRSTPEGTLRVSDWGLNLIAVTWQLPAARNLVDALSPEVPMPEEAR